MATSKNSFYSLILLLNRISSISSPNRRMTSRNYAAKFLGKGPVCVWDRKNRHTPVPAPFPRHGLAPGGVIAYPHRVINQPLVNVLKHRSCCGASPWRRPEYEGNLRLDGPDRRRYRPPSRPLRRRCKSSGAGGPLSPPCPLCHIAVWQPTPSSLVRAQMAMILE
jgi:hypothetical protein